MSKGIETSPRCVHVTLSFPSDAIADQFMDWMKHEGEHEFKQELAFRIPEEAIELAEFNYLTKQRLISAYFPVSYPVTKI